MSEIKMIEATRVRALDNYQLEIVFDDGMMGVLDLSEFVQLGEVTEPLRTPAYFRRAFVEMGVPTWPNGCNIDAINARMTLEEAGALKFESAAA